MYDRKHVKLAAKESLNGKFGLAIGTLVVAALIIAAITLVGALTIIGSIAPLIFMGVFSTGIAIVFLAIVRNTSVEFSNLFDGFKNFGTTCLSGVLVYVFTFLWSLLLVIPGIVKSYSYAMTFYILADHPEMTATEAITASRKMMDGHKFDLFVLQLSFFWWYLLCSITFGIAYFYVAPYIAASTAKFYDTIKDGAVVINNTNDADTIA